jgi:hypothetical protein
MLAALLKAGGLGLDLARRRAKAGVRRAVRQAAAGAATLLFLLLAFGFGLAAFTVWLAGEIGTVAALGFIGLFFLIVAGAIYAAAAMTEGRRRTAAEPPLMTAVKEEFSAIGEEPPAGSTIGAMGVVALIGYLFARQLRR